MNWYGIIKEEIITNKRKQGEVFDEKAFALEHNVSRTPVREAVLKLAANSVIELANLFVSKHDWMKTWNSFEER